jgi:hypothetical protein
MRCPLRHAARAFSVKINTYLTGTVEKVAQKCALLMYAIFKQLPKVNNHPNARKIAQSGHPIRDATPA